MKTVYALLVGIDKYKNIAGLDAAVSDAERIEKYLHQNSSGKFHFNLRVLHNEAASKNAIVTAFEEHFVNSNPSSEDVLLFYFSGHGTQEYADPVFYRSEPGRRLESLACYDADLGTVKGFLADKEIRWLIHKASLSGAHFLNISDSCHSGDNTKGIKAKKRLCDSVRRRAWEDFIFHNQIEYNSLKVNELDDVIPQGQHISIAACRNIESAYEVTDGGVFTTGLLSTLEKEKGDISYFDLKTRVKKSVSDQYRQSPQIYCAGEDQGVIFQTFLGGAVKDPPVFSNVSYNRYERRWELDMGGIYGVTKDWEGVPQQVIIDCNGEQISAFVTEVFPATAAIRLEAYAPVRKDEIYPALLPSLMTKRLNVFLAGEKEGIEYLREKISDKAAAEAGIKFVDQIKKARFVVRAEGSKYSVTLPNDARPLTKPEDGYNESAVEGIFEKLKKINKWSFVKSLNNENSSLLKNDLQIEVFQNKELIYFADDIITLDVAPNTLKTPIKIKLTNNSGRSLYCGAVYLSSLFGMSPNLIQGQVAALEPGEEVWARAGQYINLSLEKYIQDFNWEYETFYVQFIFATTEFGIELYFEKGLEAPRKSLHKLLIRGMDDAGWENEEKPDWQTRLIEFRLRNPNYKTVS